MCMATLLFGPTFRINKMFLVTLSGSRVQMLGFYYLHRLTRPDVPPHSSQDRSGCRENSQKVWTFEALSLSSGSEVLPATYLLQNY